MKLGFFIMPVHPLDAELRRDAARRSRGFHPRRQARLQRRLLRRASHRSRREHSVEPDVLRVACRLHLEDQARHRGGEPAVQPSAAGRDASGADRQPARGPLAARHRRRRPAHRHGSAWSCSTPTAAPCSPRRSIISLRCGPARRPTISRASTGTSRRQRRCGRKSGSATWSSRIRSRIRRSSAPRPIRSPRA